jgi:hypothetical protein
MGSLVSDVPAPSIICEYIKQQISSYFVIQAVLKTLNDTEGLLLTARHFWVYLGGTDQILGRRANWRQRVEEVRATKMERRLIKN